MFTERCVQYDRALKNALPKSTSARKSSILRTVQAGISRKNNFSTSQWHGVVNYIFCGFRASPCLMYVCTYCSSGTQNKNKMARIWKLRTRAGCALSPSVLRHPVLLYQLGEIFLRLKGQRPQCKKIYCVTKYSGFTEIPWPKKAPQHVRVCVCVCVRAHTHTTYAVEINCGEHTVYCFW